MILFMRNQSVVRTIRKRIIDDKSMIFMEKHEQFLLYFLKIPFCSSYVVGFSRTSTVCNVPMVKKRYFARIIYRQYRRIRVVRFERPVTSCLRTRPRHYYSRGWTGREFYFIFFSPLLSRCCYLLLPSSVSLVTSTTLYATAYNTSRQIWVHNVRV